MVNLKEIHLESISDSILSEFAGHYTGEEKAAENSAKITKDVAIKFGQYILDNGYQVCAFGWSDNQCLTKITTEELFQQFLKE